MRSTVREVAHDIVTEARALAPVRTGKLKSSIRSRAQAPHWQIVQAHAPYAIYVEYGTRHHHAQPFFNPAVEMVSHRMSGIAKKNFKEQLALQPTIISVT
jgi:HK97 gp10 family phage protein